MHAVQCCLGMIAHRVNSHVCILCVAQFATAAHVHNSCPRSQQLISSLSPPIPIFAYELNPRGFCALCFPLVSSEPVAPFTVSPVPLAAPPAVSVTPLVAPETVSPSPETAPPAVLATPPAVLPTVSVTPERASVGWVLVREVGI